MGKLVIRDGGRCSNTGRRRGTRIHLSESDRGTPGSGTVDWDEIYATLAAIGFKGGLAMESFISMPPEVAYGPSVWCPVAKDEAEVMGNGYPFPRNYGKTQVG